MDKQKITEQLPDKRPQFGDLTIHQTENYKIIIGWREDEIGVNFSLLSLEDYCEIDLGNPTIPDKYVDDFKMVVDLIEQKYDVTAKEKRAIQMVDSFVFVQFLED